MTENSPKPDDRPVQDPPTSNIDPDLEKLSNGTEKQEDATANEKEKRPVKVEDLYLVGAADPPKPKEPKPLTDELSAEIRYLYLNEYALGLDSFLNTSWYSKQGVDVLVKDESLCKIFGELINLFLETKNENYDVMRTIPSAESRVVWRLMCLPRSVEATATEDLELVDLLDHITIFEKLMIGENINEESLPFLKATADTDNPTYRANLFWRRLAHFVSLPSTSPPEQVSALQELRPLLDGMENRDLLYSMCIIRCFGIPLHGFPRHMPEEHIQGEDREKLVIAKKFIEDEAMGKGTSQVVQRICGMALRSWTTLSSS